MACAVAHVGAALTRTAASPACILVVACVFAYLPARAFAQSDPNAPSASQVKVRLGPVLMNPAVTFGNVGVDENVFNESTNPKRDFTMTVSPKTTVWLRFLGTWFTGVVNEDIVWYQRYASERSGNNTYSLNWKIPVTRVTVNTFASHTSTRERPGFEIDTRAERSQNSYSAAVGFIFLTSTSLDFTVGQDATHYDESATFAICDGADLCVGHVWVNLVDARRGFVGYWLLPEARGRGLESRALRLVSWWALRYLALARLGLLTEPSNHPSQRFAERS